MRKLVLAISIIIAIASCSKSEESDKRPVNIDAPWGPNENLSININWNSNFGNIRGHRNIIYACDIKESYNTLVVTDKVMNYSWSFFLEDNSNRLEHISFTSPRIMPVTIARLTHTAVKIVVSNSIDYPLTIFYYAETIVMAYTKLRDDGTTGITSLSYYPNTQANRNTIENNYLH